MNHYNEKIYKAAYENDLIKVRKLLKEQEELKKSIEKIEKIAKSSK